MTSEQEIEPMKRCYEVRATTPQDTQGDFRVYVSDADLENDYPWLMPAMRVLPIGAKVTVSGAESMSTRSIEFTIQVTLKQNLGVFGVKRERHEFRFCADSADEARALACSNVPSRGFPYDVREVQVLDCIPVSKEVFPVQGAQLRSLREVQSERDELEAA